MPLNSTELLITLINNLSYSLSLTFIIYAIHSEFKKRKLIFYILYFCIVLSVGLLFRNIPNYLMIPLTFITFLFSLSKDIEVLGSLFVGTSTIFLVSLPILFVTSVVIILYPTFYFNTLTYNILIAVVQLIISFLICMLLLVTQKLKCFLYSTKGILLSITTQVLIISVCSFILPNITMSDIKLFAYINLTILFLLLVLFVALCSVKKEERKAMENQMKLEEHEIYKETVEKQYKTIIGLGHYYAKMHESLLLYIKEKNWTGLEKYFYKYIDKTHIEHFVYKPSLKYIQNELIRNLLITTLTELEAEKTTPVIEIDIHSSIKIPGKFELNIFKLICVYLGNAVDEIMKQENGIVRIEMHMVARSVFVSVSNSINNDFDIESLEGEKRGQGLELAEKIINRNSNIYHFSYTYEHISGVKMFKQEMTLIII